MTGPRKIGSDLDAELFADKVPTPPTAQLVPDDAAKVKTQYILKALMAAGLKTPFGWDLSEATVLWAGQLAPYHLEVLEEAVRDWTGVPGTSFPSLGDFVQSARQIYERNLASTPEEIARTQRTCTTCDGVRYVRVKTGTQIIPVGKDMIPTEVEVTGMRPCPDCPEMHERSILWDRGHFDAEHQDKGGCPQCWKYMPNQSHRAKLETKR